MGRVSHASLWLAGSCWLGIWLCPASMAEVWMVTDQRHPISVAESVRLIELDAPARLQAQLNAAIPSGQDQAAEFARTHLQTSGAQLTQLTEAWRGLVDAWQLGVHTVPAVVVDRQHVVYGTTDIEAALTRIDTFRQQQP